jgi:uncharacterized membrane protein
MEIRRSHVWCTQLGSVVAAVLLLGSTASARDRLFVFGSIDFPDASLTQVSGINAGGDVVGLYRDATGKQHGFLLSGDTYTSIDFPGASATDARGIGPGGDIVGTYRLAVEPTTVPAHGYLLSRNGTFYKVDFPDNIHINTIAQRILPNGTILGCYHDTDTMGTMHGMITTRKGVSEFDMGMTMHNGATPDGKKIAGLWTDSANQGHAYLLDGDNFMSFDVPGSTFTAAWDINAAMDIIGVYRDASNKFHGFLVDADWQFTTIDFPGATVTRAFGINSRGDVVGVYVNATGTHGFIGRRSNDQ